MIMIFFKIVILIAVFSICTYIGILISKKYINREKNLADIKSALNIICTKMKFTYEPLPKIFKDISDSYKSDVGELFKSASNYMEKIPADKAWIKAIDETNIDLKKEDKEVIKKLSDLLRKSGFRRTTKSNRIS